MTETVGRNAIYCWAYQLNCVAANIHLVLLTTRRELIDSDGPAAVEMSKEVSGQLGLLFH